MSLGPLMVGLSGPALTAAERELLVHPAVGGVILFARNYVDPAQLQALLAEVHGLREPRLLVGVDQEGGRVQRLRAGFTELPPCRGLGRLYDRDAEAARRLARTAGWLIAAELRAVGVDFSFAPVLDLDTGVSEVIGDRALHGEPEAVASLGYAVMRGMREAGMAAIGKHFPGHGSVAADSHHALPVDRRPWSQIRRHDMRPFERLIHEGLAGVMMGHVVYPDVDGRPAGFSRKWVTGILRGRLGFQGAVFSDDLGMAAAQAPGGLSERARAALDAGCDMALVCNELAEAAEAAEAVGDHDDPVGPSRLMRLHGRHGEDRVALHESARWHAAVRAVQAYADTPELDLDLAPRADSGTDPGGEPDERG